jgi:ribosomal protein S1
MYEDINGLVHITEISDENVYNPAEKLKLGQMIKAKIITLDIRHRKIGLSVKALICEEKGIPYEPTKTSAPQGDRPIRRRRTVESTLDDVSAKETTQEATSE